MAFVKNNQSVICGMPRGGPRPGAGRKKGVPNKATQKRQEEVAATGKVPLDYMLEVMRDANADEARRDEMAKAAAPYVHPRLSAVEHNDNTARRHSDQIDARIRQLLGLREPGRVDDALGRTGTSTSGDEAIPTVPGHGTA